MKPRTPPSPFGIGLSPARKMESWHACILPVQEEGGWSPALCNSSLWVSVDHDYRGQPIIAGPDDSPNCVRCRRKLISLGVAI